LKIYSITRGFGESISYWQSRAERTLAGWKPLYRKEKKIGLGMRMFVSALYTFSLAVRLEMT
jgi:hypothetical protein